METEKTTQSFGVDIDDADIERAARESDHFARQARRDSVPLPRRERRARTMPNAKIDQWPTPWSLEPNARRNFVDANGKYIGSCFVDDASALVVEAVNNRNGNAAALREALKAIDGNTDLLDIAEGVAPKLHPSHSFVAVRIRKIARAALAAPSRNCDRPECVDVESAWATYCAETNMADCKGFARWLFAEAEGGDHA